ncbi:MAG: TIGR01459 family HAD-type hydrolase [Amylibacter sp.]|nr:TIGR01459 family HAD-type hydrolase [Amylibacter sp.]
MTLKIERILEISNKYDAVVFDQFGVLHDGKIPYFGAIECLSALKKIGLKLAVLSNSGKRSNPNKKRISDMGFNESLFENIMTSGEALWGDVANETIVEKKFFSIERNFGDAENWASGLDILLKNSINSSEAILLMGIPDGDGLQEWKSILEKAVNLGLPLYCSNPDLLSPRADGKLITAAGALAHHYIKCGGTVTFYGKPHKQIFKNLQNLLKVKNILMVGDSLEHDILGGATVGWDTCLVQSGIHAPEFMTGNHSITLKKLISMKKCKPPTFLIESVR